MGRAGTVASLITVYTVNLALTFAAGGSSQAPGFTLLVFAVVNGACLYASVRFVKRKRLNMALLAGVLAVPIAYLLTAALWALAPMLTGRAT